MQYTDQIGHQMEFSSTPKKIVSLVPSQTELLHDLGLSSSVQGITKFCIHPEQWRKEKTIIGGTKNPNIEKILSLNPDLVIANKEENRKEDIIQIRENIPVWTSDISNLEDNNKMIASIGEICNVKRISKELIETINEEFERLKDIKEKGSVLYLIWKNPYMSIGSDTFISYMLKTSGWNNVLEHEKRYPIVDEKIIKDLNPSLVMLSSEPFPFKQKHIDEIQTILPKSKIILVDGEMFSWYGSRLQQSPVYIERLINNIAR